MRTQQSGISRGREDSRCSATLAKGALLICLWGHIPSFPPSGYFFIGVPPYIYKYVCYCTIGRWKGNSPYRIAVTMYIKAEKVTNSHQAPNDELRQQNDVNDGLNLMARRAQTNNISSINSLNFLHKPQRISHLKTNLFPDEEILKNTNLNKKLSTQNGTVEEFDFSPTRPQGHGSSLYDEQLAFAPVYKKSGELVKSSLKLRSKSLPTSPYVENKTLGTARPPPRLQRSKSVHFDHKTPVKYFCEDESPIDVSTRTAEKNVEISYQHKPVKSIYDLEDADDEFLSMGIDRLRVQPVRGQGPSQRTPNTLRKSKRFNELLKDSGPRIPHKANSTTNIQNGTTQDQTTNGANRVVGLYSVNFPILSNKNPKTLKLNIFINLSRDKKCFLQDLTLCATKGSTDRVIRGRVLVKNLYYDKRVAVKYTWDRWQSTREVEGVYVSDGDGILPGTNMDLFNFRIDDVPSQQSRARLEFCIQYVARNDRIRQEFWDNNDSHNYQIDCIFDGFHNPFT